MLHFIKRPNQFEVYTDGSHKGRWGAWAYIILQSGRLVEQNSGRHRKVGSNQMEFRAAIEAISRLPLKAKVDLFTDSKILLDSMKGNLDCLAFAPEMAQLKELTSARSVNWHWVKAHSGNHFNERCDRLCIEAREQVSPTQG